MILGTCNPQLAHCALEIEREIGLLLPCNVVVREQAGRPLVDALDPDVMVRVPEREEPRPIAEEASRRIDAALASLRGTLVSAPAEAARARQPAMLTYISGRKVASPAPTRCGGLPAGNCPAF